MSGLDDDAENNAGQGARESAPSELTFVDANASAVTDQLWIGGDLGTYDEVQAERQLDELLRAGLTHILDTRLEWDDLSFVAERAPEISYLHLGVDDAGQRMPDEWFDEGTAFVLDALRDPQARVLVHCHMGINRGPSMGYAALLESGWEPVAALASIVQARPIAWIDYSGDATDWWARRHGRTRSERRALLEGVRDWRQRFGIASASPERLLREDD